MKIMEPYEKIYVICNRVKTCINTDCLHHKPHLVGAKFKRHCAGYFQNVYQLSR